MNSENSGIKSEGRDEPLPESTECVLAVVGNIKQLLLPRDGAEVALEGRAKGSQVDFLLLRVFIKNFSLRGRLKDKDLRCKHR